MASGMTPVHAGHFKSTPEGKFWAPIFGWGLYRHLNGTDQWALEDGLPNPDLVGILESLRKKNLENLKQLKTGPHDKPDVSSLQGWNHNYSNVFWALAHQSIPFNINRPGTPQGTKGLGKKLCKHPLEFNGFLGLEAQYKRKFFLEIINLFIVALLAYLSEVYHSDYRVVDR